MRIVVVILLLASTSCGPGDDRALAPGCNGSSHIETDLNAEPRYQADYLHRAQRDGCDIRLDVLMLRRPGSDFHCAPWPPDIVMGTPLGRPTSAGSARDYVRDPEQVFGDAALAQGFAVLDAPPSSAGRTGYELDGAQLWMVPDDAAYLYLVYGDRTERWPKAESVPGCA